MASGPEEMTPEQLLSIRARLEEPPPLLALAERHQGSTALAEYLKRLQDDRIALVDEVDRLRKELAEHETGRPSAGVSPDHMDDNLAE